MEKSIKKQMGLISVCIIALALVVIGTSYAIFYTINKNTRNQIVETGNLNCELVKGTSITSELLPMTDTDGLSTTGYNFTVKNTGSLDASYTVTIKNNVDGLNASNMLSHSYLKVSIDGATPVLVSSLSKTTETASETNQNNIEYVIATGSLSVGSTKTYNIRIWVDMDTPPTEVGKKISMDVQNKCLVETPKTIAETIESSYESNILGGSCVYDKTSDPDQYFIVGGDLCNNYLRYSGKLWRIISIDPTDNSIKIATKSDVTSIAFNPKDNPSFDNSYADQWLKEVFEPTLYNKDSLIITKPFNITESSNNDKPANTTLVNRKVGLLNRYEFQKANGFVSLSTLYTTLSNAFDATHVNKTMYPTFYGDDYSPYGIRPTVNLSSSVKISGGTGSETNPYTIDGDIETPTTGDLLNTRISGEYVKFNDKLFRIVNVESGLTKINSYDYLRDSSNNILNLYFGNVVPVNTNIYNPTLANTLAYYLNNDPVGYYQTLNPTYKNMIVSGTWYLGEYNNTDSVNGSPDWHHMTDTSATCNSSGTCTVNAMIGLPRYGEIWSNKYTDVSDNTYMWTINPRTNMGTSEYVTVVTRYGFVGQGQTQTAYADEVAVRPSMYLANNVKITGGLGTKESPFEISQ